MTAVIIYSIILGMLGISFIFLGVILDIKSQIEHLSHRVKKLEKK